MTEQKSPNGEEFQFIQEKIKRQVFWKNKWFRKLCTTLVLAVLFGVVACVTFVLAEPWARERFGEEPVHEINIPRDEEPSAEPEPVVVHQEPVVITETTELELEDYTRLFTKMRAVGQEAMKSLVVVTAGSSDMDWFNKEYESQRQVNGLLVGNNGVEELILTTYSDILGADLLQVTFADSSTAEAALKKYDVVTGLAVLSVNLGDLEETTVEQMQTVTWGNSRTVREGEPVIAIGSPTGVYGSMLFGNLTTVSYRASVVDGEYQLLLTDLPRANHSTGVLVNFKGEVVGWLQESYLHANNSNALTAYGISDLKAVIEHLCNNQDIVYLGITGMNVTKEVQEEQNLPEGVYVTGVEMDSPAMTAGIQSGDIIVDISGQEVKSLDQIQELLLNFSVDQNISIKVMRQGKEGLTEIVYSVGLSALK